MLPISSPEATLHTSHELLLDKALKTITHYIPILAWEDVLNGQSAPILVRLENEIHIGLHVKYKSIIGKSCRKYESMVHIVLKYAAN